MSNHETFGGNKMNMGIPKREEQVREATNMLLSDDPKTVSYGNKMLEQIGMEDGVVDFEDYPKNKTSEFTTISSGDGVENPDSPAEQHRRFLDSNEAA